MNESEIFSLQHLLKIGKEVLAELEVDRVLDISMDHLIEISGAERGMIILFNKAGENYFQTARNLEKNDIEHPEFEISRTIIEKVKSEKKAVHLHNALAEKQLLRSKSVSRLNILSVMCLPLIHQKIIFGVVYLDNRTYRGRFTQQIQDLVLSFAEFISLAAHHALELKDLHNEQKALQEELRIRFDFDAIIGNSPKMTKALEMISQVAETDATVLIEGESGTGKELAARAIHYNSLRREKPLLSINCAAFSENRLESEFFGHEKGLLPALINSRRVSLNWQTVVLYF
jgi:Nif-specific regulatory protein